MSNQREIYRAAQSFWNRVGQPVEQFPIDLDRIAPRAFDVAVVRMPKLSPSRICSWFEKRGVIDRFLSNEVSEMRGGIYASQGAAIIFVDSGQCESEVRFTVAHELSHYLLHYLFPRELAVERVGDGIIDALDGRRRATDAEQLSGVLRGVRLGDYRHSWLGEGFDIAGEAAQQEIEADQLAFELLAPRNLVARFSSSAGNIEGVLREVFGLPSWATTTYSEFISARTKPRPGFADWLK